MYESRIYYDDQAAWAAEDWGMLWAYLHRLCQFVGPTVQLQEAQRRYDQLPSNRQRSADRVARIQEKRSGRQDGALAALDVERMSPATRYLLKHQLVGQGRYELALERFENLRPLADVVLDHAPDAGAGMVCPCYEGRGIRM